LATASPIVLSWSQLATGLPLHFPQLLQEGAHVFGQGRFEGVVLTLLVFEMK
jgi:hypothetical protein